MGHEVFEYDRQTLPRSLAAFPFDDTYRSGLMPTGPTFDGKIRPAEWTSATRFDGLSHKGVLDERRAYAYVGATRTHFYFAIASELPAGDELVAQITAHSDQVVWDDAVEVWIDPDPGADNGITFQMMANCKGIDAYLTHARGNQSPDQSYGWKGNYRIANGIHDGYWHCQIEVPVTAVAAGRATTDGPWGINLCRDFKRPWGFASLGNRGFAPADQIVFQFTAGGAPAVQMEHHTDPTTRQVHTALRLTNHGAELVTLSAQLYLKRNKMPESAQAESIELSPGETREIELSLTDKVSDHFDLFALVTDAAGSNHFSRFYQWGPPRPARWEVNATPKLLVDFSFAYYPSTNRIRFTFDISQLHSSASLDAIAVDIKPASGDEPILRVRLLPTEFHEGRCNRSFQLPPLEGTYQITAQCHGTAVPQEPVIRTFQRTKFEWENANRGTSRVVYPPFTPIEVNGWTWNTVLKEYALGGCGLLEQVRTDDQQRLGMKAMLAAPMRYFAETDKAAGYLEIGTRQMTSVFGDRVVASGQTAGPLRMNWTSTLEYDGMLRVDLDLLATQGATLRRLDLEIPIRAEVAQYLHAMADGIRYPVRTGVVPPGDGNVWDASQLVSSDYPANFATYVFLGDASRGLCWFAENDRGWSWDPQTPNLEIVRRGGAVVLIVHLVNRPVVIDNTRQLTFGLQASPVKPFTKGWRYRWEKEPFTVIGTDIHWFGLGNCASVYPAGKDLGLWETLRTSTLTPLPDAEIDQTIERAAKYFAPRGQACVEYMSMLARKNLRSRLGKRILFYYNRSSNPACEEFQTFMDEWCTGQYNDYRGSEAHDEVKVVPSDSYIDFALHWYLQSFAHSPNTGVYVDNIYFCPSRNLEMTGAYVREDGSTMPSTGLWQLRELAKRTFVMLNEHSDDPVHMVHLTSVCILPIMSFYNIQYDWEWHFSQGDVQDRFRREYLLTVSSGQHLGAWPLVLHEQGRCVADEWTLRTYLAVTIVHELIVDPFVWDVEMIPTGDTAENRLFHALREPILNLCMHNDVEVWRYWDARPQPVQTGDPLLLAIVYARPGIEAIVAVTSYRDTDCPATLSIDPAPLGLSTTFCVTNMEDGKSLPLANGLVQFHLPRHDIRLLRLSPDQALVH